MVSLRTIFWSSGNGISGNLTLISEIRLFGWYLKSCRISSLSLYGSIVLSVVCKCSSNASNEPHKLMSPIFNRIFQRLGFSRKNGNKSFETKHRIVCRLSSWKVLYQLQFSYHNYSTITITLLNIIDWFLPIFKWANYDTIRHQTIYITFYWISTT